MQVAALIRSKYQPNERRRKCIELHNAMQNSCAALALEWHPNQWTGIVARLSPRWMDLFCFSQPSVAFWLAWIQSDASKSGSIGDSCSESDRFRCNDDD